MSETTKNTTPETPKSVGETSQETVTKVIEESPTPIPETPKQPETPPTPKVETVNDYVNSNKTENVGETVKETPKEDPKPTEDKPKEADNKIQVIEKIARDSLIKASKVHEDLLDLLPDDLEKLSEYLESDKFKRANTTLLNLQKQQANQTTPTTTQTPPKESTKEVPKPKTFNDISSADQIALGSLLRGIYK